MAVMVGKGVQIIRMSDHADMATAVVLDLMPELLPLLPCMEVITAMLDAEALTRLPVTPMAPQSPSPVVVIAGARPHSLRAAAALSAALAQSVDTFRPVKPIPPQPRHPSLHTVRHLGPQRGGKPGHQIKGRQRDYK